MPVYAFHDPDLTDRPLAYAVADALCMSREDVSLISTSTPAVDAIRTIVDAVRYAPTPGSNRVLIVEQPEKLSDGARLALNKTLEDVPPHLHLILMTKELRPARLVF